MAESLTNPCPVPEPSARAGSEVAYARPASNDRGFDRIGEALNSLLALRRGLLVADVMDPSEMPLTPSDPLVVAGIHRRWMIKTPSYLGMTASDPRAVTIVIRLAKAAGAGLQYRATFGGSSATYSMSSGALAEQYVVLTTSKRLDDTVDYQEILLEQIGWHGGAAATDYVRGVWIYMTEGAWTTVTDELWRNDLISVPTNAANPDGSAATWMVQAAQDLAVYEFERTVPTLYAGTGECALAGTTEFTKYGRVRAEVPLGVGTVRFWAYVTGYSSNSVFIVSGYTASQQTVKPGVMTKWVSLDYDVSPRGNPLLDWGGEDVYIWSVCAYCNDADYGG